MKIISLVDRDSEKHSYQPDPNLAFKHPRVDRLEQKIDRPGLVAAKGSGRIDLVAGQKDDRRVVGALGTAHHFGQREAADVGIWTSSNASATSFLPSNSSARAAEVAHKTTRPGRFEKRLRRKEAFVDVVDHQDVDCRPPHGVSLTARFAPSALHQFGAQA
jgi:hypothetical protein